MVLRCQGGYQKYFNSCHFKRFAKVCIWCEKFQTDKGNLEGSG